METVMWNRLWYDVRCYERSVNSDRRTLKQANLRSQGTVTASVTVSPRVTAADIA